MAKKNPPEIQSSKKIIIHAICLIIIVISFLSCTFRHANEMLQNAISLVDTQPELALKYLDSITYPHYNLSREDYRLYIVTKVHAKYKTFNDIQNEDDIFEAQNYYNKKANNPKMIALSNLYSGCVFEEKDEKNMAMQAYKLAFDAAVLTGDSLIMGKIQQYIGNLLNSQGLHEKALEAFRKAAYINKGMPEKQANCFALMGSEFLVIKKNDSAFHYYHKGLDLARQTGDLELNSRLLQNLSIACRETKNYEESEKYLRLSMHINNAENENIRYHLNFASLYMLMNEHDSCTFYENLLKNELNTIKEKVLLASVFSFLSKKANADKNCDSAYFYLQKCSETKMEIMNDRLQHKVYEVQQKYDYESLQNIYNRKKILLQRWIILFSFLLLVAASFIIIFVRRLSRKRQEEIVAKNAMMRLSREAAYLTQKNNEKDIKIEDGQLSLNQANKNLQDELSRKFNMLQEMSLFRKTRIEDKDTIMKNVCRIVYGTTKVNDFDILMNVFDRMNPNLIDLINKYFPDLKDTEFKVFVLSYTDLKRREIAEILGMNISSIDKALKSLRDIIAAKNMNEMDFDLPQNLKN